MKPPAAAQEGRPPSRQQIAARLAAGKAKPAQVRSSQQDIEAKVRLSSLLPKQTPKYKAASIKTDSDDDVKHCPQMEGNVHCLLTHKMSVPAPVQMGLSTCEHGCSMLNG